MLAIEITLMFEIDKCNQGWQIDFYSASTMLLSMSNQLILNAEVSINFAENPS